MTASKTGKLIISTLAAAALLLGLICPPAQADASSLNESSILNTLAALDIMTGDDTGSLNLTASVTRAEFTKMVISASTACEGAAQKTFSPYSDVTNTHWAAGYIKTARDLGLINGYLDGTFRPDNSVTLAEAVTIVLKNLGYTDADFTAGYPEGQMSYYYQLNLNDGISAAADTQLTRRQCAYLIYNMLNAKTKGGQPLAQQLGYSLDASGNLDYLALLNDKLSGPYIVGNGDWQSMLGFTPTTVYRNDAVSSAAAIKTNDVIYYSAGMKTVWAYNKQKSGAYEAASPNRSNPEAITLSGVTYQVGTSEAAYQLSTLGGYQLGEIITVLLGRDDTIVGVLGAGSAAAEANTEVVGIITDSGSKTYTNSSGADYTAEYIQVLGTDGSAYEYQYKGGTVGSIVKVTQSNGQTQVSRASSGGLSGTVNSAASKLGNYTLADDVEILDIYTANSGNTVNVADMTLHKSRLAGATLSAADVLYYETEGSEITRLILRDFSGDLYTYALLREVEESGASGVYTYILNGEEQTLHSANASYHVEKGAVAMLNIKGGVAKMQNLSSVQLSALDSTTATDSTGTSWQLAANVQIYEYRGGEYYLSAQSLISPATHTLRAYYDKKPSEGGRIRLIVALPK